MNFQRFLLPIALTLSTLALTLSSAQAKPAALPPLKPFTIPQTPIETLKSDRLLDYEPLQTLLRSGKWSEASAVTSTLMLKAGSQLEQGYLVEANIRYFPCNDLLTVDKLWRYYSGNRFGLSIQSNIWVSIGGKNEKDVPRFERRVGWGEIVENVTDRGQVPSGYFPLRPASSGGVTEAWSGQWIAEMPKRLVACQSPPKPITKLKAPKKKPAIGPSRTPSKAPKR
jgi:hypothetical protein